MPVADVLRCRATIKVRIPLAAISHRDGFDARDPRGKPTRRHWPGGAAQLVVN